MDTYIERRRGQEGEGDVAEGGEEGFRAIETDVRASWALSPTPLLISCGGGVVVTPANPRRLPRGRLCGVSGSDRRRGRQPHQRYVHPPLFQNLEAARARCEERLPLYEAVANVRVSTAGKSVPAIAREVQRILEKEGILCPQQR